MITVGVSRRYPIWSPVQRRCLDCHATLDKKRYVTTSLTADTETGNQIRDLANPGLASSNILRRIKETSLWPRNGFSMIVLVWAMMETPQ